MNLSKTRRIVFVLASGALLALVMVVLAMQPVRAAGPWYVDAGGDDGNDCLSSGTPCATINGAIGKASAGDTIYVAIGAYTGTGDEVVLLDKDATLSGGWGADFGAQSGFSIIDGEEARRGITVPGGVTAVVDRFTVQNGYTGSDGGGVRNSGTLTMTNCAISDNFADYAGYFGHGGGGIYNVGALTLSSSTVSNNTSTDGGGGILATGGSSTVILDSKISSNTAGSWEGGGVQIHDGSDLSMSRSWVVGNAALGNDGGGIGSNNAGSVYVENSIIAGNIGGTGGGLFFTDGQLYHIVNSHIVGNEARYRGAAIVGYYAQVEVTNTLIISNTGNTGIDDQGSSGSEFVLSYCDTYGNSPDGTYEVTITRTNCLGTPAEDGLDPLMLGGALPEGVGPAYADEWMGYDYRLLVGSPAIDAGTAAGAPAVDIEGNPRDATPDMGAYELVPGVSLSPRSQTGVDKAGSTVAYTIMLGNHTGATDSFSITLQPGTAWTTTLSLAETDPIPDGDSLSFTAWVEIPAGASPGEMDSVTIQATSLAYPTVYSDTTTIATHAMGDLAYVTLSGSNLVALVDTASHTVMGSIDVGSAGCDFPWQATMSPDRAYVYVSCYNSGNVAVIETADSTVVTTIGGIPYADGIAFTRDGAYALVGSRHNSQVAVVDTATYSVDFVSTPSNARSVAVHPYLDVAYVTSGDGTVQVIDTTSFSIVTAIPVGAEPWDVAVSPDGAWVFAGSRWGEGLAVIDAGSNTVHTRVTGLGELTGLAVAPDGSEIYAAGLWNGVHVVNGLTFDHITTIGNVGTAWELAVTCDGAELYVGNRENYVAVIDTTTREKLQIPMPGSTTRGIAICPQTIATGMFLVPSSQVKYDGPGEVVAYEERLVNASGRTDSFTLSLAGNAWDTSLSVAETGPVPDGDSFSFTVWVTIPVSALPGETDSVTLEATSVTSPTVYSDTATMETRVMGDLAYVTLSESNLVALVDMVSYTAIGSIDVGSAGCQYPWRATMSPDGAHVYVACRSSGNVAVIETAGNTVETTVGGISSAGSIAFVREGAFALVGSRYNNQVAVVDTATYSVDYISTPSYARSVAAHPYLDVAYATSGDGTVQVIDTTSFSIATSIPVGTDPYDVAVSPDGQWVFAGSRRGEGLAVFAAGSNTVHTRVTGLGDLTGLAVAPDGSEVYAASLWNGVHIIDGATFGHITTLGDVGSVREVAVSCDGGELYIGNKENQVPVVDTGTLSVAERIAMPGSGALGTAICPQAKQTGVFLVPASQVKYGGPGDFVTYEEYLVNASGRTDSFTLSLAGNAWDASLSVAETGPVPDGDTFSFTVGVTIPVSALPGETDSVALEATSITSPTVYSDTATIGTGVMGDLAYATLSDSDLVALVDTVSHTAIGSIDVGSAGCDFPWRAAMTPDGAYVYVSCYGSGNVAVVETAGNTVATTVGGIPSADGIAFTRDGAYALVGSRYSSQVAVVDTATYSVDFITTPSNARSVAVHPYLDVAYATCGDGTVQVIDTTSFSIVAAIPAVTDPWDVAVSPDGQWVFAGSRGGEGLAVVAAGSNTVHTTVTELGVVTGLEVAPDGSEVYAAGLWNGVHIVDGATFDHITTVGDVGAAWELAVTRDGSELYVGNRENYVAVIDTATREKQQIPMPGSTTRGIAICPQAKQTGVFLVPASQVKYGGPGEVVTYEEHLVNASGRTDSFTLSLAGNAWDTSLSIAETGPVPDGDSFSITVGVTIPVSASPGDADSVTLEATSVTSPTVYSDTATIGTRVMGDLAYVTLSGSNMVALVDTASHTVMGSIDVGSTGCDFPWQATMTPDRAYVYVSCYNSGNVAVIETAGNTVVTTIGGIPYADGIAFTRDGAYALVGSRHNSQVAVVDTATYSVDFVSTPSNARSVAVHPYLDVAYVTSGDGTVQVIDTTSFSIVTAIPVGAEPWDVAVSPDGAWVFAGSRWGEGLAVIAAGSNTVHTTVTGLGELTGLAVAPGGSEIYAAGLWNGVHVIDGATFDHITTVWDVGAAWELAVTCDGAELYVGNRENYVAVIDTATRDKLQIPMPGYTTRGIAICPQYVAKGVFVSPPAQTNSGGWGETVAHQGTLLNMTGATDTFSLELGSHAWDATLSADSLGPIPNGDSAPFTVYVTVPEGAEWYSTDTVSVTATSVTSPTVYSDTVVFTTEAYAPPQISVSPELLTSSQYVNEITQETLTIGNGNGVTLEFEIGAGSGVSFLTASTELYGYDVSDAWLRVVGTQDDTHVKIINLDTGTVIDENTDLDRYETWDVYPNDGTFYKIEASQPVVGYESDQEEHSAFVPSLDSGPVGMEFIFYYNHGAHFYVFAMQNADVMVYDPWGNLVASRTMAAGEYWELTLPDAVYHVISTGRIAMQTVGSDGYTTVPSITGEGVGRDFYFACYESASWHPGSLAVFAYEDVDVEVYDLDSSSLLYTQHINEGDYWWQTQVGTRRLELQSTGKVEVWVGATQGGSGIENLGDDLSFAGGDRSREYYLHSLMGGSVVFALLDNTQVDVDGSIYHLNKDEYLHLDGCCFFRHIQSNQPILIQTLGRDSWWDNLGTYLGGVLKGGGDLPSWVTMDATSGTVTTNDATPVQFTFDATGLQPGTYGTEVIVQSNDPVRPSVSVPVSMTVEPTADMGWVEGTVTDSRTGDPLEATIVAIGQPFTITADADTGSYLLWLVKGSYTLQVSAEGYVTAMVPVDIKAHRGTIQDVALVRNAPVLEVSPPDLSVTQNPGDVTEQTLTISNDGPVPMDFNIGIGQVPGGAALEFDGTDDQLNMGNSDVLMLSNTDFTVEAWISTTTTSVGWILGKHDAGWGNGYGLTVNHQDCAANKACFDIAGDHMAAISTSNVNDGQWHHIAGVYSVSGEKRIYIDGVLEDTQPATVSIPANTDPFRVGYLYDNNCCEQYQGQVDEVRVWALARTEAEIQGTMGTPLVGNEPGLVGYWRLDEGSGQTAYDETTNSNNGQLGTTPDADPSDPSWFPISSQGGDVLWLTLDLVAGTVPAYSSVSVQFTFDATGLQPGTFGTEVIVQSNDPVRPSVSVPVSMTVEPTADMGWVEGTVTDNRTGDPLEATIVAIGQPFTITADADTGSYLLWLVKGSYTLQVSAEGYVTAMVPVDIKAHRGTIQDVALVRNAPVLQVSPPDLSVTQNPGDVTARTLTISNDGPAELTYDILGTGASGSVLQLHLDEPAGATTFYDSSGNGNHASCLGASCPTAGVEGPVRKAVSFDGIDDYLQGPDNALPSGAAERTLAFWMKPMYDARVPVFYGRPLPYDAFYVVVIYDRACIGQYYGGPLEVCGATNVVDGNWHHSVLTYDDENTVLLYLDGVPEASVTKTYSTTLTGWFHVGKDEHPEYFPGLVDEVAIYDRALSAEEVEMLYSHGPDGDLAWLSTDPVSGTVPAYSSVSIQVNFDATGIEPGDHTAEIAILSNDPVMPSVVVPVEMTVSNLPPEVTVTPETQEVQYSDLIDDITIEALDNVAEVLSAGTTWSSDGSSFSPGLPAGLELTGPSCSDDGVLQTCTWNISGAMSEPAGTYTIRTEVSDGYGGATTAEVQISVEPEDAEIWLDNDNPATIQVEPSVGYSPAFSLTAYVREIVPDEADFGAESGDLSNAKVEMTLAAVGPGNSYSVECSNVAVTGVGYEQVLEVACEFDNVEVNTYHVQTTVVGGHYTGGPDEAILVVFDPSLDSTAGSGWFYWPDTADAASGYPGDKTNFGYVVKYNQRSQQVNGSLLLIRHLDDGSGQIYQVKSNALTGLSLGEAGDPVFGWASFSGKCTYKDKDWEEPLGNYGFLVYVEDHGEPGRDADQFWIEVYDKDGNVIVAMSMDRDASENTVTLGGGNIVVPHGAE